MRLNNQWKGGKGQFKIPSLSPEYRGASGAVFKSLTFAPNVGEETALLLLDDPQYSRELGELNPFHLKAITGMVRTSAGIIAYIIWVVSSRQGHVVDYEHTLNPFESDTTRLLNGISQQTHLKQPGSRTSATS
jgi:hypothetical protein